MQAIASRNAAPLQEIILISVALLQLSHIAEALRPRISETLSLQLNIFVEYDEICPFQWLHHTHAVPSPCYMVFLLPPFVTVSLLVSSAFFSLPKDETYSSGHIIIFVLDLGLCSSKFFW